MNLCIKTISSDKGFALVTAILMLFAATVLGLMVMNSSEIEILLSGAQQRYERDFNTTDGAVAFEATAVGKAANITFTVDGTTYARNYNVVNPGAPLVLSPQDDSLAIFNPYEASAVSTDDPGNWPMDNLLHPENSADASPQFDYHYRVSFDGAGTFVPKGYSAEKFTNYQFSISASHTATIDVGGSKIGPKINL